MAISFPRDLPGVTGIETSRFGLTFNNTVFTSPVNNVSQVLKRPGSIWGGTFKLPAMTGAAARQWKTWLVSLGGAAGTFTACDPDAKMPLGSASTAAGDSPQVDGAGQTGTSLATKGWRLSQSGLLLPGDYIQIGGTGLNRQFKMVTEQVNSDALGKATISFEPALHASPPDSRVIVFENPVGIFRLEDDAAANWETDKVGRHGFSFSFIEVPEV